MTSLLFDQQSHFIKVNIHDLPLWIKNSDKYKIMTKEYTENDTEILVPINSIVDDELLNTTESILTRLKSELYWNNEISQELLVILLNKIDNFDNEIIEFLCKLNRETLDGCIRKIASGDDNKYS